MSMRFLVLYSCVLASGHQANRCWFVTSSVGLVLDGVEGPVPLGITLFLETTDLYEQLHVNYGTCRRVRG
jgi:hypothetical protein